MVKIIESNLIVSEKGTIKDHQSRVIEADNWDDYCKAYDEYDGNVVNFKVLTSKLGSTIPKGCNISFLLYDNYHLWCDLSLDNNSKIKRLAYLI